MTQHPGSTKPPYTCKEYREEMILAALQRSLQRQDLTPAERERIQKEIHELEIRMGM